MFGSKVKTGTCKPAWFSQMSRQQVILGLAFRSYPTRGLDLKFLLKAQLHFFLRFYLFARGQARERERERA